MKEFRRQGQENRVLFVCIENAARSQMAEGFFRKYAPKGWTPVSAGTRPTSGINPLAIEVMKEAGVDISMQHTKQLSEETIRSSDLSVNMGCMDKTECPAIYLGKHVDWGIDDPRAKPKETVRKIRDEIEMRVRELCKTLE